MSTAKSRSKSRKSMEWFFRSIQESMSLPLFYPRDFLLIYIGFQAKKTVFSPTLMIQWFYKFMHIKAISHVFCDSKVKIFWRDIMFRVKQMDGIRRFYLMLRCGLSVVEVTDLTFHAVEFERKSILVLNGKFWKDGIVFMSDDSTGLLQANKILIMMALDCPWAVLECAGWWF